MDARTVRRSLVGAAVGGGLFAAVSLYRSWMSPGSLVDYLGPVGLMVVIGATVGGLVGPLVGRIAARRSEEPGSEREGEESGDDAVTVRRRQPLWITLLAGAGVGFGVGTAWDRVWLGVGLGLCLALLSRRIFR